MPLITVCSVSAAGAPDDDDGAVRSLRHPGAQPGIPFLPQERQPGRRADAPAR